MDLPSVLRLLDFLEALFNGGSDFNEPLKRCLNRLTEAKWANSDILLVSGEALVVEGAICQSLAAVQTIVSQLVVQLHAPVILQAGQRQHLWQALFLDLVTSSRR